MNTLNKFLFVCCLNLFFTGCVYVINDMTDKGKVKAENCFYFQEPLLPETPVIPRIKGNASPEEREDVLIKTIKEYKDWSESAKETISKTLSELKRNCN